MAFPSAAGPSRKGSRPPTGPSKKPPAGTHNSRKGSKQFSNPRHTNFKRANPAKVWNRIDQRVKERPAGPGPARSALRSALKIDASQSKKLPSPEPSVSPTKSRRTTFKESAAREAKNDNSRKSISVAEMAQMVGKSSSSPSQKSISSFAPAELEPPKKRRAGSESDKGYRNERVKRRKLVEAIPLDIRLAGVQPIGMINQEQMCYRRAVLQALLRSPLFVNWLEYHSSPREENAPGGCSPFCMACSLRVLARAYVTGSKLAILQATQALDRDILHHGMNQESYGEENQLYFEHAGGGSQCDPWDFFTWLKRALSFSLIVSGKDTSTLDALFNTSLVRYQTCAKCSFQQKTTTHSADLTANIPGYPDRRTFPSLLQANFCPEEKHFGDVFACPSPKCNSRTRAAKDTSSIVAGAEILVVQIQRRGDKGFSRKHVKIPRSLDLTQHLGFKKEKKHTALAHKDETLGYKLAGVVCYNGEPDVSGHYIAYVADVEGEGVWVCDDSEVRKASERDLTKGFVHGKDGEFVPHMAVYVKDGRAQGR